MKYYRLNKIKKYNARYNFIFGERSNGKTFACLEEAIRLYCKTGKQTAYIRRWYDDIKTSRAAVLFDGLLVAGVIEKLSGGKWKGVYFSSRRWYLCKTDEKGNRVIDETPFMFAFSLSTMEHDKSTSYPNIKMVIYDECITRTYYIPDEFIIFCNEISTIVRDRDDVIIYMLGNTVNWDCPYFYEMGLTKVRQMTPGTIDLYAYGESGLKVAVEYTEPNAKGKPSDVYFAFNNPKLKMITGGVWEMAVYPHLPAKYKPKEVVFEFFIEYNNEWLHCDIVTTKTGPFIYVYPKKEKFLKNPDKDYVYTTKYSERPNYHRNILKPTDKAGQKIYQLFRDGKVFYQSNPLGEIMRAYLMWCGKRAE